MDTALLENLKNIITITGILGAGIWTYYRFGISREKHPKLEFDLKLELLGIHNSKYLIQLVAIVENRGLIRQYITDFTFNLLVLDKETKINLDNSEINNQTEFNVGFKKRSWVIQKEVPFIDGGIKHQFTYNTALPNTTDYVMIYSKFHNRKKKFSKKAKDTYHVSRAFNLKEMAKHFQIDKSIPVG